jgi:hypothetical protein
VRVLVGRATRFLLLRIVRHGGRVPIIAVGVVVMIVAVMIVVLGHLEMAVGMVPKNFVSVFELHRDLRSHAVDHPDREDQ